MTATFRSGAKCFCKNGMSFWNSCSCSDFVAVETTTRRPLQIAGSSRREFCRCRCGLPRWHDGASRKHCGPARPSRAARGDARIRRSCSAPAIRPVRRRRAWKLFRLELWKRSPCSPRRLALRIRGPPSDHLPRERTRDRNSNESRKSVRASQYSRASPMGRAVHAALQWRLRVSPNPPRTPVRMYRLAMHLR